MMNIFWIVQFLIFSKRKDTNLLIFFTYWLLNFIFYSLVYLSIFVYLFIYLFIYLFFIFLTLTFEKTKFNGNGIKGVFFSGLLKSWYYKVFLFLDHFKKCKKEKNTSKK